MIEAITVAINPKIEETTKNIKKIISRTSSEISVCTGS